MIGFQNPSGGGVGGGGIMGSAGSALRYPHPFFDVGQTYMPISVKHLFRWCHLYYQQNGLVNTVVNKMAQYPVTKVTLKGDSRRHTDVFETLFRDELNLEQFVIACNVDYYTFGNAYCSVHLPIIKYLECPHCNHKAPADSVEYRYEAFKFKIQKCSKCHKGGNAKVSDLSVPVKDKIRLIRWNPEDIDVIYNDTTGESSYILKVPENTAKGIRTGNPLFLNSTPQVFLDAVSKGQSVLLSPYNLYHMKRESVAGKDIGYGQPLVMPALKDLYLMQVLKKSQECVSPDTLLETTKGLMLADEVVVGDHVRTHTGQWREVERRMDREAREGEIGVALTLSGLRPFESTYSAHHPVLTVLRNNTHLRRDTKLEQRSSVILKNPHLYEEHIMPAEKVRAGSYLLFPRELPAGQTEVDVTRYVPETTHTDEYVYSAVGQETAAAFETLETGGHVRHDNAGRVAKRSLAAGRTPKRINRTIPMTDDFAYLLGWYAGDGSVGSRRIDIHAGPDNDLTELFGAFERQFGVRGTLLPSKKSRGATAVFSDVLVSALFGGLLPGTAHTKRTPQEVMNGTFEHKLAYLKGLWAADGCVDARSARLVTVSRDLAYDAYRLLLHVGCIPTIGKSKPNVTTIDGREVCSDGAYYVTVTTASRDRLVDLFADRPAREVLSGKSGFFWKDYFASRVWRVRESAAERYIDFKVDTDSTFCTVGTATKNCIAHEHIVPLRILHPAPSGSTDPVSSMDLGSWQSTMRNELLRWRQDPNYTPIVGMPIGFQYLGGQGKSLLLTNEIKQLSEMVVTGMNVPIEFAFGGMSFSGSSVSLRMLENQFQRNQTQNSKLVRFIINTIARFLDVPPCEAEFVSIKTADDIQRKQLLLNLAQSAKISDKTLLSEFNLNYADEVKQIEMEQATKSRFESKQFAQNAENQGQASVIQAKYQARAQREAMMASGQGPTEGGAEEGGGGEGGQALDQDQIQKVAKQISAMPEGEQAAALEQLKQYVDPQALQAITQLVQQGGQQGDSKGAMEPQPEQKPPRRGAGKASV